MPSTEDELGGDPPCWAHLFNDEICAGAAACQGAPAAGEAVVDLAARARAATAQGVAWAFRSDDLDANLLVFPRGEGVTLHSNTEVDVLLIGVGGHGIVEIEGTEHELRVGQLLIVPKRAHRAIRSLSDPFTYVSIHRRRTGLWPTIDHR